MKPRSIALVEEFRHSVPYINIHRNKTFVIMLDGEAIANENFHNLINDIGLLHSLGIRLVIVYGATPQIDNHIQSNNIVMPYHKGLPIIDGKTLECIKQVAGSLQLDITARLSMSLNNTPLQGANIHVVSGNFIISQPIGVDDGVDYCHLGRIRRIDTVAINNQLNNKAIVLIGPVVASITGENFYLPIEEIAKHLTVKLAADKLIGFSSTQGLIDENGKVVAEILPNEMNHYYTLLKERGEEHSMTGRFFSAAMHASRNGIKRCHLISYCDDGALLQELFSREGIGTQLVMESAEQTRQATIHDIGGILELIRPLEQQGILVRRSREQLEREIDKFIIIERERLTIACVALYLFPEEKMAEMACLAVHPNYRNENRGEDLLNHICHQAKSLGVETLFVLTTRSIHWFQERGFIPADIDALPLKKKELYNYQRNSKILLLKL